jgi:hypothetical protein
MNCLLQVVLRSVPKFGGDMGSASYEAGAILAKLGPPYSWFLLLTILAPPVEHRAESPCLYFCCSASCCESTLNRQTERCGSSMGKHVLAGQLCKMQLVVLWVTEISASLAPVGNRVAASQGCLLVTQAPCDPGPL